jgi:hypothetical protein
MLATLVKACLHFVELDCIRFGQGSEECPTLYGRVRYPLCGGCRCRPMQPMGSRQLAPKGMRCNGSRAFYGGDEGILCGPGIAGFAFRLLYKKPGEMVTSIDL